MARTWPPEPSRNYFTLLLYYKRGHRSDFFPPTVLGFPTLQQGGKLWISPLTPRISPGFTWISPGFPLDFPNENGTNGTLKRSGTMRVRARAVCDSVCNISYVVFVVLCIDFQKQISGTKKLPCCKRRATKLCNHCPEPPPAHPPTHPPESRTTTHNCL